RHEPRVSHSKRRSRGCRKSRPGIRGAGGTGVEALVHSLASRTDLAAAVDAETVAGRAEVVVARAVRAVVERDRVGAAMRDRVTESVRAGSPAAIDRAGGAATDELEQPCRIRLAGRVLYV